MAKAPAELLTVLLSGTSDAGLVASLCDPGVVYVSLNYDNPDLKKVMPWCGTHTGVRALVDTFLRVSECWTIDSFKPEAVFGDESNAAAFGRFTYTSNVLGKTVTSPFAVFCKAVEGKVTYLQFMEDTFATAASFRSGGLWKFQSDPLGGEVEA